MQQLFVIRGKLPFLSCMVSRVRLVKRSLQKRRVRKPCVQPYRCTKTRVRPYRHLTRQTKNELTISNSINLQKKERKAPFVFM